MERIVALSIPPLLVFGLRLQAEPADSWSNLKIGDKAHPFELKGYDGKTYSLDDLLNAGKPVALVFFRSAGWCPLCKKQLLQLQGDAEKIEAAGVRLVGISYDSVDVLKNFADKQGISYLLLSDEGSKTIDAYGVRNTEVPAGSEQDGIPHPGTLLLDKNGIVRAKLREEGYVKRHTIEALLEAAKTIE